MKKSLNTFFLMTFFFKRFLNQIWLKITVFWTDIEKNVLFNPIFKYFTIYKKLLTKHTCCQQKFLSIVKYLNIGLKNTFFSMLVQKTGLFTPPLHWNIAGHPNHSTPPCAVSFDHWFWSLIVAKTILRRFIPLQALAPLCKYGIKIYPKIAAEVMPSLIISPYVWSSVWAPDG